MPDDNEKLMDKNEVAALIGVSPRTVEKWILQNSIPFIRVASLIRFRRSSINEWLSEREQPAKESKQNA